MENLRFVVAQSKEIAPLVEDISTIIMSVFYDFPYLYVGNVEYEKNYIQKYINAENGFAFVVYDGNTVVGATTAIPLSDVSEEIQQPFLDKKIDISTIFYFGESILLPQYRGRGVGHRFFDEREKFVLSKPKYDTTAFCCVNRSKNHPLKPANYRPNDVFWTKRGYTMQPDLVCNMAWKDRNEELETIKELTFWTKKWK